MFLFAVPWYCKSYHSSLVKVSHRGYLVFPKLDVREVYPHLVSYRNRAKARAIKEVIGTSLCEMSRFSKMFDS